LNTTDSSEIQLIFISVFFLTKGIMDWGMELKKVLKNRISLIIEAGLKKG
jgi:hypothetical protein